MRHMGKDRFLPVLSREEGTTMSVEFVLIFPLLAITLLGIIEFGHLWMVRHTLTIATREGARAAVVYVPGDDAVRATDAIETAKYKVTEYLGPDGAKWDSSNWTFPEGYPKVTYNGTTGGLTGGTLTVKVQTNQTLLVLHKLITDISVVGETTMRFE